MNMAKAIQCRGRPVWAEISLKAIAQNLHVIRRHIGPKPKILAVVKSNAYGLGAVPIAKALQKAGAEWFGVTCANEGIELREAGIRKPILVLTGFWPGEEKRLIQNHLTPTVTRLEDVRNLERAAKSARVKSPPALSPEDQHGHEPPRDCCRRKSTPSRARWPIAATSSSKARSRTLLRRRISARARPTSRKKRFESASTGCARCGVSPGIVHMANSGAICARPSTWADMVRPGAILYGYYQSFDPPQKGQEVQRPLADRAEPFAARANHHAARSAGGPAGGLQRALRHRRGLRASP